MIPLAVEIARNRADQAQIAAHLRACDGAFVTSLGRRVDLDAYATKIVRHAERFEAWSGADLAGLVAAYANDPERRAAFVTSVSVLQAWHGRGLASCVLAACVEHVHELGFARLELEVDAQNDAARRLYAKHGFVVSGGHESMQTMCLVF